MTEPAGIEIRGLRKRYGDTRALAGLDLAVGTGEVLGIAGPNGAGKSTLIRMLAGEESPDEGELLLNGEPWSPTAEAGRVAVVHQEPALFPNLSVAENLLVGREGRRFLRPRLDRDERSLMAELGLERLARRQLALCTLATQQRTEIARALAREARIFLFDEPNSALTDEESNELFREIHGLAGRGRIVMLVSHRLSDLVAHCSRVAIVREGRVAALLEGAELTQEAIAHQLVLEEQQAEREQRAARAAGDGREVLRLAGWTHGGGEFADVELTLRSGDIVALVGVEGSGARELLRSAADLERSSGTIEIDGARGRAATRRTAYVPATRQLSLFPNLTVGDNVVVRLSGEIAGLRGAVLRPARMRRIASEARGRFLIKARSLGQGIRALSGGNQQKVAIAQALTSKPRVLLLEEPTRGVDIQSRREIYRLLRDFADEGNVVLMYCTEVPEVFEAADRVYVVSDGRLSPPLETAAYERVETLAAQVSKLERHSRDVAA